MKQLVSQEVHDLKQHRDGSAPTTLSMTDFLPQEIIEYYNYGHTGR